MAGGDTTFYVMYDLPSIGAWNVCFKSIEWHQSTSSELAWALHTFQAKVSESGGEPARVALAQALASDLTQGKPFVFKVGQLGGDFGFGPEQQHIVDEWWFDNGLRSGSTLIVKTVAALGRMNITRKNRAHQASKISDMVKQIVREYQDLALGDLEETEQVPEFGQLRQVHLTDYEFITSHLCPRAMANKQGGYELASVNGSTVRFATPPYKLETYKADDGNVITVEERDRSFPVTRMGGGDLVVQGFDHYRKAGTLVRVLNDHVQTSLGSSGMSVVGERFDYVPLSTQDAVNAWALSRHAQVRNRAYAFTAHLRGDLKFPGLCLLDLTGTKYRETDNQRGVVTEAVHSINRGVYDLHVTCERDKFNP